MQSVQTVIRFIRLIDCKTAIIVGRSNNTRSLAFDVSRAKQVRAVDAPEKLDLGRLLEAAKRTQLETSSFDLSNVVSLTFWSTSPLRSADTRTSTTSRVCLTRIGSVFDACVVNVNS